jgi:hypothetical protein
MKDGGASRGELVWRGAMCGGEWRCSRKIRIAKLLSCYDPLHAACGGAAGGGGGLQL